MSLKSVWYMDQMYKVHSSLITARFPFPIVELCPDVPSKRGSILAY